MNDSEIRAQIAMLTIAVQALYLAHPNGERALIQLQRLADGSRDSMQAHPIPDATLDRLNELLQELIAAIGTGTRPEQH